MLAYAPLDEKSLALLLNYLHDFLEYLAKNSATLFSASDYVVAPPEYERKAVPSLVQIMYFGNLLPEYSMMDNRETCRRVFYCLADKAALECWWFYSFDTVHFDNPDDETTQRKAGPGQQKLLIQVDLQRKNKHTPCHSMHICLKLNACFYQLDWPFW
eukprot:bmy_10596T0